MEFIQTEFNFEGKTMTEENEQKIVDLANSENDDIEEVDDSSCLNLETLEDADVSNIEISKNGEWVNKNLVPIEKINVYIPESLYKSIRNIEKCVNRKFNTSNEFSIYIHGEYDEEGDIIVSEDFYIPKQKVGVATVDYLEQPDPYYNGCLHKHPDGCTNFSGIDKKYINSNFEFSLLYVLKEIRLGIVNIQYHQNRRIQVPANILIMETDTDDINIDNIVKYESPKPVVNYGLGTKPVNTPRMLLPGFGKSDEETIVLPSVAISRDPEVVEAESLDDDPDFEEMFPEFGD